MRVYVVSKFSDYNDEYLIRNYVDAVFDTKEKAIAYVENSGWYTYEREISSGADEMTLVYKYTYQRGYDFAIEIEPFDVE